MRYFFQHITQIGRIGWIVLSALAVLMWLPDFLNAGEQVLFPLICTLLLSLTNAFLLMAVVYQAGVSKTRSGMPLFLFLLIVGSLRVLHTDYKAQLVLLIGLLIMYLLFKVYHNQQAVSESFLCSLLLSVATLLLPDMWIFLPLIWIAFAWQRAFSLRVWLASLVGVAVVAVYFVLICQLGWVDVYPLESLYQREILSLSPVFSAVAYLTLVAWGVLFAGVAYHRFRLENSSIQSFVLFSSTVFFISGIMLFFPLPVFPSMLLLAACSVAGLQTRVWMADPTVFNGVLFLLNLIIWPAVYVLQLI